MKVTLRLATLDDAQLLWDMQKESFRETYERYRDEETSPYLEPLEKTCMRIRLEGNFYYVIFADDEPVGGIYIRDHHDGERRIVGPLFVLPKRRNHGIAQKAMHLVESIHGSDNWGLDTIQQEAGNCHLYEKMGYRYAGVARVVNDCMTLIYYNK